ncbi:protein kinase domain-containing protein [Paramicrobacterium agarici]|uniref:protein kinase domain-containing protein n=1 Tax=Paramicrobacterium agarici TaxID=630514 RepID=UPI001153F45C|nr:protein kinase [Microbacterium agarici]TQO22671.1 serine/threonine-protein kinase [Microbacterium agarici]
MRPMAGVTFGGRYELESRIAIGGMGEVWKATDNVIGRTVAIKILKDEYMGDPGFLERFRAEARHAALVNHEGIANVFDYGEENGSAFLVMELVPGEALSSTLEREHVLSTDATLDIVAQTAAALQAAHTAGLVHRDIKPGNLLITPDRRVKITDFGIARIADQVPLTATGQVMGTVQYLSPEQASGHPASPATDIYSLGIVAYECLAGKRPFTGESQVAIAMAQINDAPPELPATVAEPVRNLVFSMIAKNPDDRPASTAHVVRAANALRRGDVSAATAAVPAVGEGTGGTSILPGGNDDATQVINEHEDTGTASLPVAGEEGEDGEKKKKRSPWTWPLIVLIAVLALVLAGTIFALVNMNADPNAGETSTPPSTDTSSPRETTTEPTPENTRVSIDKADFVGLPYDDAAAKLSDLGLKAEKQVGDAASSADQVNTVYDVNPFGRVNPGETVTLTVYGEVPPPETPPAPDAPAVEGCTGSDCSVDGVEGQDTTIRVTWNPYRQCPAGEPTNYQVSAPGANPSSVDVQPSGSMSTNLTIPAGTDSVSVSLIVFCDDVKSDPSDSTNVTVNRSGGDGGGTEGDPNTSGDLSSLPPNDKATSRR